MPIHESQNDSVWGREDWRVRGDWQADEDRVRGASLLGDEPLATDAVVQAQVALRLIAGLVDHLAAAGVLAPDDGARIAEQAANRAEAGGHTLRGRIAEALRRIIAR